MAVSYFFGSLVRRKTLKDLELQSTQLDRCLSTLDLIGLGVGSTLGAGLYVVTGQVAHDSAGPAVTISFLVAAVASALAGLCYAEFASRIPRAGSAYVYSYVTVGELMAFVIGWNLILEYIIGTASVARGWSTYFDSLVDKSIAKFFNRTMPINVDQLSEYPDFFAFGITIILTILLSFGVRESTRFNNVFTCVNLMVVLYVTVCGMFQIDWHNWRLTDVPKSAGSGGFMPFGFSGMMEGAATCFYAFVGFDCVATTGEETKNPQRAIPIGIIVSLILIFISYFSVSAVITLMCPYYLLDPDAALPAVFERVGWGVARYIITIGAVCGLSTSLLGAMFPLPRILYAMAGDGLMFKVMGKVSDKFKTPIIGTVISGLFAGTMAMLFNLKELVDMMSIGTLLAYTLVSLSVLILRYETDENLQTAPTRRVSLNGIHPPEHFSVTRLFIPGTSVTTELTASVAKMSVAFLCIVTAAFSGYVIFAADDLMNGQVLPILLATILAVLMVFSVLVISRQPQSRSKMAFKVPFVPLLPAMSALVNVYLMFKLSAATWMRFGIWMALGFAIYFLYGIRNSSLNKQSANEKTVLYSKISIKDSRSSISDESSG